MSELESSTIWCSSCGIHRGQRRNPGMSTTELCPVCIGVAADERRAGLAQIGEAS